MPTYSNMKVSQNAINLVKKWEGLYLESYKDPVGIWTIGYGTTVINGKPVTAGMKITKAEAEALLRKDIDEHASTIFNYVKVPLTQNQYDALASFQYNLGKYILQGSTLLTYINNKQWEKAAAKMKEYNKGGGKVLQGLVNRRNEEASLFLGKGGSYTETWQPAVIMETKATEGIKRTPLSDEAYFKAKEMGLQITSGFRGKDHPLTQQNPNSDHAKGQAYDFAPPEGLTAGGKAKMALFYKWAVNTGKYKQVIYSPLDGWSNDHYDHVHIAFYGDDTTTTLGSLSSTLTNFSDTASNIVRTIASRINTPFDEVEGGATTTFLQINNLLNTTDLGESEGLGDFLVSNGVAVGFKVVLVVIGLILLIFALVQMVGSTSIAGQLGGI